MRQANPPPMPYPLTQKGVTQEWMEVDGDAYLPMDNDFETYDDYDYEYIYPQPEPDYYPAPQRSVAKPIPAVFLGVFAVIAILIALAMNLPRNGQANGGRRTNFGVIPVTDHSEAQAVVWEGGGTMAPLFTKEVKYWGADIDRWSAMYDIDPNMVATIMQIESCGHPGVASHAGAQGLFQVMPFHFTYGEVMTDPDTNAKRGINYLKERLAQTGNDWRMAAAGYNGGHVASASEYNWVQETRSYVVWAEGIYADASAGKTESETLNRWLSAGGQSLCDKAAATIATR